MLRSRKKDPIVVRRALLDSAGRIAANEGFAAVTLQTVAAAANVTKGGLFHHFINKQALIDAMIDEQLENFDKRIATHIEADEVTHGRFTRAYVLTVLDWSMFVKGSVWGAMASYASADHSVRVIWSQWMRRQLEQHVKTDNALELEVVRLAADGAWLCYHIDNTATEERIANLRHHLIRHTLPKI